MAPILLRCGAGVTRHTFGCTWSCAFVFFSFSLLFTVLTFARLIWNFLNWSLVPSYWGANTLPCLLYADLDNNAKLKTEHSLRVWNRLKSVPWWHEKGLSPNKPASDLSIAFVMACVLEKKRVRKQEVHIRSTSLLNLLEYQMRW